ncbi:MAG: hypothetical protein NT099_08040 [Candidatus Saganbacteria bacterium]|nr:hypothetical protein [Candidatus Saganbacteria bacterium]
MSVNQIIDKNPAAIKDTIHEINIEIGENYPVKNNDSKEPSDPAPAPFWA